MSRSAVLAHAESAATAAIAAFKRKNLVMAVSGCITAVRGTTDIHRLLTVIGLINDNRAADRVADAHIVTNADSGHTSTCKRSALLQGRPGSAG